MYARFGQELYAAETITAATIVADHADRSDAGALLARVEEVLPHSSCATRKRIATKLMQRLAAGALAGQDGGPVSAESGDLSSDSAPPGPADIADNRATRRRIPAPADTVPACVTSFARLLSRLPDTSARHDLVYYAAARADSLIGAIATEILYPYFIEGCIPAPYGEDEFIMANAGLLLAPEPILTAGFVADYARRAWDFDSERTVGLALRILRQAGILLSAPLLGTRGRVAAYTLAPHGLSLTALLWGFYDEFGGAALAPAWDQVARARVARVFVVPAPVVASRLWDAERAGLVGSWSAGGARRVALKVRDTDALARLLLTGRMK